MSRPIDENKVVVFTGAGISAESGIATFRGEDGIWNDLDPYEVSSIKGWESNPSMVLAFHNQRLKAIQAAQPNAAHLAVKKLEEHFEVIVITQNVDDLHERAGSSNILHLHGSALEAYGDGVSPSDKEVITTGYSPIAIGDVDGEGRQLRPHIVLFGEDILHHEISRSHIAEAGKILVVGTSLSVFPAANLLKKARFRAEKTIVSHKVQERPHGYKLIRGNASVEVPKVVSSWIGQRSRG